MTIKILEAKSGFNYLKIQKKNDLTLIIFETQEYIFDYIYEKLNIELLKLPANSYNLNILKNLLNEKTYEIFKIAFILREELKDFWDSFNDDYYACYDSQFFDIRLFDDKIINQYDYWGRFIGF